MSLTGTSYQKPERILGNDDQNPVTEDTKETGKFRDDVLHVQSRIHSDYDSAESNTDSDLEDGELRKMLASPLYVHGRGSVPTVLKKVVNTNTEKILFQKVSLSPRQPPKIILQDTWQVQREDFHERGTSTARPVADDERTELKIVFRVPGIPHAEGEKEDDQIREIRRLVRQVKNHP